MNTPRNTSRAPHPYPRSVSAQRLAPWLLAAALALAWLALAPATPDLAAQVYRAGLFEREGYTLYDLYWYGGHHMPGYSLLFPPLARAARRARRRRRRGGRRRRCCSSASPAATSATARAGARCCSAPAPSPTC